jgi:hypothetical protein
MTPRTFPGPWRAEASESAYVVTDAKGFAVAYLYWKPQPALRDRFMTRTEALLIAEQMAKLPDLLEARPGL